MKLYFAPGACSLSPHIVLLDDDDSLTEGPAIVQYVADQKPASRLAPAAGTKARYHLIEWLNYITS